MEKNYKNKLCMFCFGILFCFDWVAKLNDKLICCCAWHCVILFSDSLVFCRRVIFLLFCGMTTMLNTTSARDFCPDIAVIVDWVLEIHNLSTRDVQKGSLS